MATPAAGQGQVESSLALSVAEGVMSQWLFAGCVAGAIVVVFVPRTQGTTYWQPCIDQSCDRGCCSCVMRSVTQAQPLCVGVVGPVVCKPAWETKFCVMCVTLSESAPMHWLFAALGLFSMRQVLMGTSWHDQPSAPHHPSTSRDTACDALHAYISMC